MVEMHRAAKEWISRCAGPAVQVERLDILKKGPERQVWTCDLRIEGDALSAVLTIFLPGDLQSVNTSLPPQQVAQKCALAMSEFPIHGIPTPCVFGYSTVEDRAALLAERVETIAWTEQARTEAATALAHIHRMSDEALSENLRHLIHISDPRQERTTGGRAPKEDYKTLVHGDFFSLNILQTTGGLKIIDWETLGLGDPMWDLGFLVGADRDLTDDQIEVTIAEYELTAPVNRERLDWHRKNWSDFWRSRDKKVSTA